jgi:hypothetical protein
VIGADPDGHLIIRHEVVTENHATTDSASALMGKSGQPVIATPMSQVSDPQMAPTSADGAITSDFRYVQVLAMNSADGMSSKLYYTYSSSTGRQTDIDSALEYVGSSWGSGAA